MDLNLKLTDDKIKFKIYRKPTTTDITIHAQSFHPQTHKMSAYHSYVHRLLNTPLDNNDYNDEVNTLKYIAHSNGYDASLIDKIIKKHKHKQYNNNNTSNTQNNKKYIAAQYSNLMPTILCNTFNKINTNVSFKTHNSTYTYLKNNVSYIRKNRNQKTGIYKLNCNNCDMFYLGQTGRPFHKRFNEHLPTKNLMNLKSNFAKHIINKDHKYTNIDTNLTPIHICSKGTQMDAIEEFEIYRNFKTNPNLLLNDQLAFNSHHLYDTAMNLLTNTET